VRASDGAAARAAAELQDRLTKPRGALGELEAIGVRLAAMAGECPPPVPEPALVAVFAGDHGVVAEGVTPWPQDVTGQMVANFVAGGAAVNVLARHAHADVLVVDVGVASSVEHLEGVLHRKVLHGTRNLRREPAMTSDEARAALDVGAEVATAAVTRGDARCLVTGEMGIGNTTASAALIAAFTGRSPATVAGRGTGIDDAMLATKIAVISDALDRTPYFDDPVAVLASLGGLEIAALVGYIVAGAAARVPVIVDGVIACAALVVANALCPDAHEYCIAGHRSSEPGATIALEHVGLRPVLDLELRLGEGTGAVLALPIVQSAAKILREMATFDAAGVTEK
jgi:nicotinate-nucleotide--dimethylbenzimidazole phosphoribosyltransferase